MVKWIPYSELPIESNGLSKLFIDYIEDYSIVKNFYSGNYRSEKDWETKINDILERKIERSKIVQILMNQNRDFHCGVKTLVNIDQLLNENTFVIATGQQVGLFGGPLYTLYKALTAIKLSEKLSSKYPDYSFVPLFWLESEDHDIDEVSSISFLNASNELISLNYKQYDENEKNQMGPVGNITLDENIKSLFYNIKQSLIPTEFSPKVFELFETAYQNGMTFSKAFVHLMNVLLENSGLIFFDPHDEEVKKLLKPIFLNEISNAPLTCQLVINQSDIIEKRYHAQIKPRAVNLFMFYNNGRYGIEPKQDGFFLKRTRKTFTKDELIAQLESDPSVFSPNVVLRPICQDYIFPTLAYVAGPSEVAYFAQLKPLYEHFKISEPIIYPRASATIIEDKINNIIEKYDLNIADFYSDVELLKKRVIKVISDFKVEDLFSNTKGTISESLTSLKDGLETIDPTLVPAMENTLSRILSLIETLKEKTLSAQQKQHEISLRQLDKVAVSIFPHSKMQEREFNLIYFLNKYGLEFLRWLRDELIIDKFMHQYIYLE